MDSQANKKALYRAKLKEVSEKREKRIDSPLVRYNEYDQPMCRVCDVLLKSDSLWNAHLASRKHHEAIEKLRATASGMSQVKGVKSDVRSDFTQKPQASFSLQAESIDKTEIKKQKTDSSNSVKSASTTVQTSAKSVDSSLSFLSYDDDGDYSPNRYQPPKLPASVKVENFSQFPPPDEKEINDSKFSSQSSQLTQKLNESKIKVLKATLPEGFFDTPSSTLIHSTNEDSEVKQVKGSLPEGFFDNKDADLRARGIEPVKVDIKDEYKEFEKMIQEDLQEIDSRLEEEEIDAADVIEEFESAEQRAYWERVEMLKRKQLELKEARLASMKKGPAFMGKESSDDESSSEDGDDGNYAVDWRAKKL